VPGYGDALLPSGQLGRQVAGPLAEPDLLQGLPGSLAALGRLDPDEGDPGFHATETIHYVFVLAGELHLEQDGGEVVRLSVGDCVVQRGTNHKWEQSCPAPAAMAAVLIGAERRT
jgi:mannose-6-phosphate isomerase-like protein (cupin superfamily)